MACSCDGNTVVRSCAPYANADDVNSLLAAICPNCAATLPPGTDPSNFCALGFDGAMEDCCEFLTVFEGTNIWFSTDCSVWTKVSNTTWDVGDIKTRLGIADVSNQWLLLDGNTVGNAASNATHRANADMETLFTHMWTNTTDTEYPIVDSAGAPVGVRGASAAADWAANYALPLPDGRGRVLGGMDDPTGADAAGVVTDASADILGDNMGEEEHTTTIAEMPAHTHTTPAVFGGAASTRNAAATASSTVVWNEPSSSTGGDGAHNTMQPTLWMNHFMYTGN